MVRGQTVAQSHRQFQRLIRVYCFESSTHAHQYTITGQRYLLLSDKLLEHPSILLSEEVRVLVHTSTNSEAASFLDGHRAREVLGVRASQTTKVTSQA